MVIMYWRIILILSVVASITTAQDDEKPSIYSLHIDSYIKYRFAVTRVTSKIANPANVSREVIFDVDVPGKAFISNFSIHVDDQAYYGRIQSSRTAKSDYTEAKKRGESAGLISTKPNEFNKFVVSVHVAAKKKVLFNLTYEEILERKLGEYSHEISIKAYQPIRDLEVKVTIQENRALKHLTVPLNTSQINTVVNRGRQVVIDRPTPTTANIEFSPNIVQQKDGLKGKFIVKYDVERDYSIGEVYAVDGYFVHFFAPEITEAFPRDILFLLDTSTSMTDHKLGQMKDAMIAIIKELGDDDRFNIMVFDKNQNLWSNKFQPATDGAKSKALKYIKDLRTNQYTDIYGALLKALQQFKTGNTEGVPMIFLLTDGEPTVNQKSPSAILKNIRKENEDKIPIYSLAFGSGADWNFLYKLSFSSGGVARRIFEGTSASLQIAQFYREVSSLLLEDIKVTYPNTSNQISSDLTVFGNSVRNYYSNGSEFIMAGQIQDENITELSIHLSAQSDSGPVEFTSLEDVISLTEDTDEDTSHRINPAGIIERMWAFLTIKTILKDSASVNPNNAHRNEAERLAMKYGFVTPVTSMVVVTGNIGIGLWKDYEEDLNELHKRTPLPTIKPRPTRPPRRWGGGGGGGGGWGGGGGDPHFMIGVNTLDYPLCFDVVGDKNQVYTLFKDAKNDITVNVRFDTGVKLNRNGGKRVYIKEAAIMSSHQVVYINNDVIEVDNVKYTWDKKVEIRIKHAWLLIDNVLKVTRVYFDIGVEAEVARRSHNDKHIGDDFINVEVRHEEHSSFSATGLVGQFLRKDIELKLLRMTDSDDIVAHLTLTSRGVETESRAKLVSRHDPVQRQRKECWMLRQQGLDTIVKPEKFLVSGLFDY